MVSGFLPAQHSDDIINERNFEIHKQIAFPLLFLKITSHPTEPSFIGTNFTMQICAESSQADQPRVITNL